MLHIVDEGAGDPVVLLHAYPCDHRMWDAQAAALVAGGWRVLRPDLPGFGASPVPQEQPSLRVMAEAVLDGLDRLGVSSFALGGLSMGGYVAMQILRQEPQRVAALLLIDTKSSPDAPEARANRYRTAEQAERDGTIAALADGMLPGLLGATTLAQRPDVVARTRRFIADAPGAGAAWAMRAMAERPDSAAELAAFDSPSIVVMGEEDALSQRADHEQMAAALPRGRLVVIGGCGHLSALERPEAVGGAILEFLRGVR